MTNKFKLLILDFDGTVGDSRRLITDTMLQTIDALGLETRTREQCARMIGLPLVCCFTEMIPMTEEMGEKCATTYREFFKQNNRPGAVTLFPGVADTLQRLHNRHIHLSFASSRRHASLAAYVNDLGLSPFISYLIGADDVHRPKPKAEPVEVTLRHFGIAPKDALVVGDTKFDILMGHNAGTHTCGVSYGNGSREELEKAGAEHIIDTFTALSDL